MEGQGETYTSFIEAQLKAEMERKDRLDSRAIGVITTSSALAALFFGFLGVAYGKDFVFSGPARWVYLEAIVTFLSAAIYGLIASVHRSYEVAHPDTLFAMLGDRWGDTRIDAMNQCARINAETVGSLRRKNDIKSDYLLAALMLEIAAVAIFFLATALSAIEHA